MLKESASLITKSIAQIGSQKRNVDDARLAASEWEEKYKKACTACDCAETERDLLKDMLWICCCSGCNKDYPTPPWSVPGSGAFAEQHGWRPSPLCIVGKCTQGHGVCAKCINDKVEARAAWRPDMDLPKPSLGCPVAGCSCEEYPESVLECAAPWLYSKLELARANEGRLCCVCMVRPHTHVSTACGHMSTCEECSAQLDACPICRAHPPVFVKLRRSEMPV